MADQALDRFERVEVTTRTQWRDWLSANHEQTSSVWVVTFKKGASKPRVPYDDLVEEALAFGWVDSLPRKLDAERTMLLMSPRKPGSNWSAVNKARIETMTAAGLMHPAGLAKIERPRRQYIRSSRAARVWYIVSRHARVSHASRRRSQSSCSARRSAASRGSRPSWASA